ncbi:Zinc finger, RING/FYVE/PHD-type [Penicillium italicum]|uniref:Zinc finger, RING/FYVE/PHD-type n=1 Tax=Penicillium italicum TaxID=40296 RepID=A0A0A2KQ44_PENIT|nr:Zinc finger, RING/FYVE/PHD-type [Penicillium italicum]
MEHLGQYQTLSASRRRPAWDSNDGSAHRLRQEPPLRQSTSPEPVQPSTPFVTATMLQTNSVPWSVSPDQPAILSSASNVWAGVQDLTLQSFRPSQEHANERVILRCRECTSLCHLSCAEEWLERRDTGFSTSCCVCRNEGALDAFLRPLGIPASDAETGSVPTASESSPTSRPRRSARLAGPHPPRDQSTSASLRRSARLSTQQNYATVAHLQQW